jgi:glycosyl transferase family 25
MSSTGANSVALRKRLSDQMQIPVFVINLDRSPERLSSIAKRLNKLSIQFERVAAVDGSLLTNAQIEGFVKNAPWRRKNTPGEIACYLSHLKVMKIIRDKKIERAVILEDDANPGAGLNIWLDPNRAPEWPHDILKLEGVALGKRTYLPITTCNEKNIVVPVPPTLGSACYCITLNGALKVLERLSYMRHPYDNDLTSYWRNRLKIYDVFPYPVTQENSCGTTIGHRGDDAKTPWQKHRTHLIRLLPKKLDKTRRFWYHMGMFGLQYFKRRPIEELVQ